MGARLTSSAFRQHGHIRWLQIQGVAIWLQGVATSHAQRFPVVV